MRSEYKSLSTLENRFIIRNVILCALQVATKINVKGRGESRKK